jgi:hypothetical protein
MAELSFLTIIVSLAVCSLLIYAVFQYTKIRLTILEQSQKEQALILQQFIEESSTDIHRLYQLSTNNNGGGQGGGNLQPHDSIILEYANDFANHDVSSTSYTKPAAAYNEPHIIHLDTALFKNNNKSNLIEISSDSEDTTDSGSESDSGSEGSESGSEGSNDGEGSESDSSDSDGGEPEPTTIHGVISEVIEVVCDPEPISDIKLVTVDLGAIQESLQPPPSSSPEHKNDVLSMLYKKAQETTSTSEVTVTDVQSSDAPAAPAAPAPAPAAPAPSLSSMSVPELRHLLKEKYKNNPEKHPEIQKLKKVELIYALQTTQS